MGRSFRKQDHTDFRRRVKTVDPVFYRWGEKGTRRDATVQRPIGSTILGFGWAYLIVAVANNRQLIESSLRQGNLTQDVQGCIMMVMAGLLAASGIMLLLHLFRYFAKGGAKRRNSGGLLIGALGALVLSYTPASVWNMGLQMMDGNSRAFVQTASSTVNDAIPGLNLSGVAFVSSQGR